MFWKLRVRRTTNRLTDVTGSQRILIRRRVMLKKPLKRGVPTGSSNGFKAIKPVKVSAIDQAIGLFEQGELSLEKG